MPLAPKTAATTSIGATAVPTGDQGVDGGDAADEGGRPLGTCHPLR